MKEKVLLVNPPSPFLIDERVFLPLGLAYIASIIKKDHEVRLLDLSGNNHYEDIIVNSIKSIKPTIVGFTSTSPQFFYTYSISKKLKKCSKN